MKELVLSELSIEQKIGQLLVVRKIHDEEDRQFIYQMLENRSIGGVQVNCAGATDELVTEEVRKIHEHADYPVLVCADMESGFPLSPYHIPSILSLAATNNEELAYQVGCVTAIEAKKRGYNTVWGPVVDLLRGNALCTVTRCFGSDPHYVSKMATAMLKGYYDNGMFATAKHFPGASEKTDILVDNHMGSSVATCTEQDILEFDIIPYLYAMKEVELDGVMIGHTVCQNIDPDYPASLSAKVISLLRNAGYDGIILTDSFAMMGVLEKFPEEECYGLAVRAGNDMILPNYRVPFKTSYQYLLESFKRGIFDEARLDEAVARVLRAQKRTLKPATQTEVSEYQKECMKRVYQEEVCAITDGTVPVTLDPTKKHLFVVMTENLYTKGNNVNDEIVLAGENGRKKLQETTAAILKKYPDAEVLEINQFPSPSQVERVCYASTKADDIIFITFNVVGAYQSSEALTQKVINLIQTLLHKTAAVVHFGNPYAAEDLPHIPRLLLSFNGNVNMEYPLAILSGEMQPKGKSPVTLHLK